MNANETQEINIQVGADPTSHKPWIEATKGIQVKVLSVDEGRNSVEFLFKIEAGYNSGRHRHTCETHIFVIQGKIRNHTAGCDYGPGDYCYQPMNDDHIEEALEETTIYGSYRGVSDKLIEFLDERGEVCGEFRVGDFSAMLKN